MFGYIKNAKGKVMVTKRNRRQRSAMGNKVLVEAVCVI